MSVFDRKDYADIGKTAAVDEFSQAFREASTRKKKSLINGAIEAFRAGNVENLQDALSESRDFSASFTTTMLRQLSEGSDDRSAAIDSAFAKAPEEYKKTSLTKALVPVINCETSAEESFVAALLKSGADANAYSQDLTPGCLLAWAVFQNQPVLVVQLLVDHGASVEGAVSWADARGWNSSYKKILEGYLAKTTSKPAAPDAPDADIRDILLEMREEFTRQIGDLAARVDLLAEEIRSQKSPAAAEADQPAAKLRLLNRGNKGP